MRIEDKTLTPGKPAPAFEHAKFEYLTKKLPVEVDLNIFAAEGWEVMEVISSVHDPAVAFFYFRRPRRGRG